MNRPPQSQTIFILSYQFRLLSRCLIILQIITVMGQYQSQSEPSSQKKAQLPIRQSQKQKSCPQFQEHEGILKLRKVPFRNSIQISQQPPLFLENLPDTLFDILQPRYNTNKHLSEQQIQQFVEAILYTLSYLQTKGITYNNLCTENIHIDEENGIYKLLPLQLIELGIYEQALKNKNFGMLSPELILGLRYKEKQIQPQIMNKSNVFTFGMILLQIATLQPSIQCYDTKESQILDDVITQRLQKVHEIYQSQIYRLIQIMIEYDYTKRMNLQELSILVNKTLAQNNIVNSNSMKKSKSFSRFKNIDESLSQQKSQKQTFSRMQEKSIMKNVSPSRLKANIALPVNYHQAPKSRFTPQLTQAPTHLTVPQQKNQYFQRQNSNKKIQYEYQQEPPMEYYQQNPQQLQHHQLSYQQEYGYRMPQHQHQPQAQFAPYSSPNVYMPPPQIHNQNHSQISYQNPYQYSKHNQYRNQQINQYHNKSNGYQYNENNQPPAYYPPKKTSTVIYPQNFQNTGHVYYEPELDIPQQEYNVTPQRLSSSYYQASQSPSHYPYEESAKINPYINYQEPLSKQLSFEQDYEDSFSKNQFPSASLKSQSYMPTRDTNNFILKQSNIPRYQMKGSESPDQSDSSIVKIKEQIAKSRELIMQLQRNDSGNRR